MAHNSTRCSRRWYPVSGNSLGSATHFENLSGCTFKNVYRHPAFLNSFRSPIKVRVGGFLLLHPFSFIPILPQLTCRSRPGIHAPFLLVWLCCEFSSDSFASLTVFSSAVLSTHTDYTGHCKFLELPWYVLPPYILVYCWLRHIDIVLLGFHTYLSSKTARASSML